MAKLYFRYGVMGSSKTANALMAHYNYKERDKEALLVKPEIDTRDGENIVRSRIGLNHECVSVSDVLENLDMVCTIDCIIVDEAQFLSFSEVKEFAWIADTLNIPVICYGLRTDFRGRLFEGSEALFRYADVIEEIKTICWCGKKATFNARIGEDGEVVKTGEQVVLGANDKYTGLCREHWCNNKLG